MGALTGKQKVKVVWTYFMMFMGNVVPNVLISVLLWMNWPTISTFFKATGEISIDVQTIVFAILGVLAIGVIMFVLIMLASPILSPVVFLLVFGSKFCIIATIIATISILMLSLYNVIELNETFKIVLYTLNMVVPVFEGAMTLSLGEFEEDSSHAVGSHYEISFDSDGKGNAKEVTDYEGGGEWITNILLFLVRVLIVYCVGTIIFVVKAVKFAKYIKNRT